MKMTPTLEFIKEKKQNFMGNSENWRARILEMGQCLGSTLALREVHHLGITEKENFGLATGL